LALTSVFRGDLARRINATGALAEDRRVFEDRGQETGHVIEAVLNATIPAGAVLGVLVCATGSSHHVGNGMSHSEEVERDLS
jgi:hypothetical protein